MIAFIKKSLYVRIVLWTFGSLMFIPYIILGIKYTFLLGHQAIGPWMGFSIAALFVAIGVVPILVWTFLKLKKAMEL